MTNKILIIPWHDKGHDVVTLLKFMLTDLGYVPIILDEFLQEVQFSHLAKAYHLHKPGIIITYAEEDESFGENLCKLIKKNFLTKNVKLLYLETLTDIEFYPVHGMNYCKPDEYLRMPFTREELKKKVFHLFTKSNDET